MNYILFNGKKVHPSKIVCIGQNYMEHIKELHNEVPKQPVLFIKPNSSISHEILSSNNDLIHYEGEISFIIRSNKLKGVAFGLDLTKREVQSELRSKGLPWERSKSFDGSAVFSEFVMFEVNIHDLRMELSINGSLVQQGGYELMMNKPDDILHEASTFLSFEDGDIIMTGTPKGVGPVHAGDTLIGKIFDKETLLVEGSWVVK
ncbi:MAG: fumarylacetoacetate hydrolase family protein [Candidatus Cloacimonetes bacterium]|nr:fumarylacetoacetate hydrolase family protein [Candidatus Cloacimonadota bacterium]